MLNVPNLITLLRLATVPVFAWLLLRENHAAALLVFMVAAASDWLDGYIARRYHATSRFGATLDPVADKLSMFVATVVLAWQGLLPLWLAVAIVLRDVIIVAGAIAYRMIVGPLEMAPTQLSKLNTTLEFGLLLAIMAIAAQWLPDGPWLYALFVATGVTVVLSGAQYVWIWGRKAAADHARRLNT
jgi:cardiolipin synthase